MDEPKGNASRDEWAAFASQQKGVDPLHTKPVEEGGMTRDDLKATYGTDAPATSKVVHYVGRADERHITETSWKSIGVTDQKDTSWVIGNRHRIALKDFSKAALEYFERDGDFVTEDA
jgi:hypothetical protein